VSHTRGSWAACAFVATCATGFAQITTLEGVSSQGIQGTLEQEPLALTADARFLLMGVRSFNLVPGDTNNDWDLYLRDRQNGAIERVSVANDGAQANEETRQGDVSADGRFVAFASIASNLIVGDSNGMSDVFLRDRQLGTTTLVSRTPLGAVGNHPSQLPAISADGRWIAFLSIATDLVAGDINASEDVFVYDAQTSAMELVCVSSAGAQANSLSFSADISGDGRFVVFATQATNLGGVGGFPNRNVYLRDRLLATTVRLSEAPGGVAADSLSERPAISEDGAFAAFESAASNLVVPDDNGARDVFVVELATGAISLASVTSNGTGANSHSLLAALSADGRYVAFVSWANNLAPGDTTPNTDVYLRDRQSSTTTLVSIDSAGVQGWFPSNGDLGIGAGPAVAFATTNALAIGDSNQRLDAFVRDLSVSVAPIEVYCTAKTNSLGCTPVIIPIGTPRASGFDSFFLTAVAQIGNKPGLLIWSRSQASIPFGGGFLCLRSPIVRTPVQNSGGSGSACNGTFSFHMTQAYMVQQGIQAGDTLNGQYWARDQGFAPPNNISLTNAATWIVAP
jgi:Tol biopolymer transport system component